MMTKEQEAEVNIFKRIRKSFLENNQKDKFQNKIWTEEEDERLINLINNATTPIKWKEVALHFDKNSKQCYSRFKQINPKLNRGKWTREEEEKLKKLVEKHGKKWSHLAKFHKTRSSKQIRDHYNNCMDTNVKKKKFTEEEDRKIKNLYMKYGPRWSQISKYVKGRTGDAIKNRYYWSIKNTHTEEEIEELKKRQIYNENHYNMKYRKKYVKKEGEEISDSGSKYSCSVSNTTELYSNDQSTELHDGIGISVSATLQDNYINDSRMDIDCGNGMIKNKDAFKIEKLDKPTTSIIEKRTERSERLEKVSKHKTSKKPNKEKQEKQGISQQAHVFEKPKTYLKENVIFTIDEVPEFQKDYAKNYNMVLGGFDKKTSFDKKVEKRPNFSKEVEKKIKSNELATDVINYTNYPSDDVSEEGDEENMTEAQKQIMYRNLSLHIKTNQNNNTNDESHFQGGSSYHKEVMDDGCCEAQGDGLSCCNCRNDDSIFSCDPRNESFDSYINKNYLSFSDYSSGNEYSFHSNNDYSYNMHNQFFK